MEQLSQMEQFLVHGIRFLFHTVVYYFLLKFYFADWRRKTISEFQQEIILRLRELNFNRGSYEQHILEKEWDGMEEERKTKAEQIQSKFISRLVKKEWDEIMNDYDNDRSLLIEGGLIVDRKEVEVDNICVLLKIAMFMLQYYLLLLIPYFIVLISAYVEWLENNWVMLFCCVSVGLVFMAISHLILKRPRWEEH